MKTCESFSEESAVATKMQIFLGNYASLSLEGAVATNNASFS